MTFKTWRCFVLLAFLLCGLPASAQETGKIDGRVTKDGEGVGAVVILVAELKLTEVTDQEGRFVFDKVPPGAYTLILTLGDNNETRQALIYAGQTLDFLAEVDWNIGASEKVTVTAAARAAKIVDAPSAVTSIPQEQVARSAATGQVPKVLEFTPGAEVTQSGLYDFNFNTRGFNSSLNRRVSTYIDGRDVGVVLLGAQEWAAIAGGLDDVANLEFIRGPSAALYGANASSGVVNITTMAPRDSLGTMVRLTAGDLDTRSVDFRWAAKVSDKLYSKVTGGFKNSGDFSVSRNPDGPDQIPDTEDDLENPEYSTFCELVGETNCLLKERTLFLEQDDEIRYGSVRFDRYINNDQAVLTFEAGMSDIKGPAFQTGIGRVQALSAERPFFRFNYANDRWSVLGHYAGREGDQANLTQALRSDFALLTDTKRYGAEGQWNRMFADNKVRFVAGAAYTKEEVDTADPDTGVQTVVYAPIDNHREAIFFQLDWTISQKWKTVFAGREDWNQLHDPQFSPKAAVVYSINPKNSIRLTYNEAFQVANYSEFFLHTRIAFFPLQGFADVWCNSAALDSNGDGIPDGGPIDCDVGSDENGFVPILAVGNEDLELEQTRAWEIGYSGLIANKVFITVDYYNQENENFITDLVPQVSTILGDTEGCVDTDLVTPLDDPRECPINTVYGPWIGSDEWENTLLIDPILGGGNPAAEALRNSVQQSVGGDRLGFRLAEDLDGSTVVIGRTYTNVGQVNTQGVDFGIQFFASEPLSVQASYSWFDFEIIDDELSAIEDPLCELPFGEPARPVSGCLSDVLLPNSPEHKASLSISYVKPRWSASISGRWVEGFLWSAGVFQGNVPQPDEPGPAPPREASLDDYTTVDLSAFYAFNETIALGVNVANLLDNVHRQTFGGDLLSRRALVNLTFRF